jgi:hypothetical protein
MSLTIWSAPAAAPLFDILAYFGDFDGMKLLVMSALEKPCNFEDFRP